MQTPDIDAVVRRAKAQILSDAADFRFFPVGAIAEFSELHDYVDANEYGGLTRDPAITSLPPDTYIEFCNEVQLVLDRWIRAGGIAGHFQAGLPVPREAYNDT